MLRITCVFLLVVGWSAVHAQNTSLINVSGKVMDADSLTPIGSVYIYVPNQDAGAISNENGFFSIQINPSDTLVFSAVNYLSTFYILPDSLRRGRPYIEIPMQLRTIKLKKL